MWVLLHVNLELLFEFRFSNRVDFGAKDVDIFSMKFVITIIPFDNRKIIDGTTIAAVDEIHGVCILITPEYVR